MVQEVNCKEAGYDNCDFLIRSENEDELIQFVKQHSEQTHGQTVSDADVRSVMQDL